MFKTFLMTLALTFAPVAMATPTETDATTIQSETMQTDQPQTQAKTRYSDTTIEACAHAGYEFARAKAGALGDTSQPHWYALSSHSRELRCNAVREALAKHGPGDSWAYVVRSMAHELEPAKSLETILKPQNIETEAAQVEPQLYGQINYEAYAQSTDGKTHDGLEMPMWLDLPDRIQQAWISAAEASRNAT